MADTNLNIEPETADLLTRTAESRTTSVDSLVREMLAIYTSIELRQVSEDIERVLDEDGFAEEMSNTTEEDKLCPHCYCDSVVESAGSVGECGIYRCVSEYCSLDMFIEPAGSEQDPDLQMMTEIIDANSRWDKNG
jgi:hypothetical protein